MNWLVSSTPSPPPQATIPLQKQREDHAAMALRIASLEARQVEQAAALASVMNECRCLRAHSDLLEARLEAHSAGFQAKFSQAIVDITLASSAHAHPHAHHEKQQPKEEEKVEAFDIYKTLDLVNVEETKFDTSIWDASCFIGFREIGCLGSLYVLLLLMLHCTIQGIFLQIINESMTDATFDAAGIERLTRWQLNLGLSSSNVGNNQTTVAAQPCDALNIASFQSSALGMIDQYLPRYPAEDNAIAENVGPVLCLLALLIWFLCCIKEFDRVKTLALAILAAPGGSATILHLSQQEDALELASVSCGRKVTFLFVLLVRMAFLVVFVVIGLQYLTNTWDLGNLILNVVVLQVVLNVDKSIFDGLSPSYLRNFLRTIKSIRVPRKCQLCGLDLHAPVHFILLIALILIALFAQIQPNVDNLQAARHGICSGNYR